jgi:hypothetical protein
MSYVSRKVIFPGGCFTPVTMIYDMQYLITRAWKRSSSMKSIYEDSTLRPMTLGEATKTCFTGTRASVRDVPIDASTHLNSESR